MSTLVQRVANWKKEEVEELKRLINSNKVVIIADLTGFPADKLHEIRRKLRDKAIIRVTKNSLFEIALKESGKLKGEILKYLTGQNGYIFTNENPFIINQEIVKLKMKRTAKPGDIANEDVIIPAGPTGIAAGPMLSVFGKLKIPTKVQDGSIHVAKDTKVASKGEKIPSELIPILQKLGIEPIYVELKIKIALEGNLIINGDLLKLDIDKYKSEILNAFSLASAFASEIVYPEPNVIKISVFKAFRIASELASESSFITPETISLVLNKAISKAFALAFKIGFIGSKVEGEEVKKEEKAKEEEKGEGRKEPSEEDIAGGLSSLFG